MEKRNIFCGGINNLGCIFPHYWLILSLKYQVGSVSSEPGEPGLWGIMGRLAFTLPSSLKAAVYLTFFNGSWKRLHETNMKDNGPPQPLPLLGKEDLKIFTLYNTITHALVAQYLNISIPLFLSVKLIYLFQKTNFNGQWTCWHIL